MLTLVVDIYIIRMSVTLKKQLLVGYNGEHNKFFKCNI